MSTIIGKSESKNVELPEPGNYPAICYQLVLIGTIKEKYMDQEEKEVNKMMITWELPSEKVVFKEGDEPKPFVVSRFFNKTSDERGNLFKWLTRWSPKINKDNIHKFDLKLILGQPCLLSVDVKKRENKRDRLDATGIASVPKGMTIEERTNEIFFFDVEDFDQEKFNTLPEFIREMIVSSKEFKESELSQEKVLKLAKEANGKSSNDSEEEISVEEAESDAFGETKGSENEAPEEEQFF